MRRSQPFANALRNYHPHSRGSHADAFCMLGLHGGQSATPEESRCPQAWDPRVMVIAELGQPVSSETKDGKR